MPEKELSLNCWFDLPARPRCMARSATAVLCIYIYVPAAIVDAVLRYAMLCYAMLFYAMLFCARLCW
eukprot:6975960-Pyramimonas_sp.AAC.1